MNYQKLYECLFCAVRTAGIVANMMQATIVNEGKQVEVVEDEDERHLRMREAKTRVWMWGGYGKPHLLFETGL